jgi:hypothetical protein
MFSIYLISFLLRKQNEKEPVVRIGRQFLCFFEIQAVIRPRGREDSIRKLLSLNAFFDVDKKKTTFERRLL